MNMLNKDRIDTKHLPIYLSENIENRGLNEEIGEIKPLNDAVEVLEKSMIIRALKRTNGNISKAGNLLRIPRQTLHYKLNKYEIDATKYIG